MPLTQADFERCALTAGLVTQEQLTEAHAALQSAETSENPGISQEQTVPDAQPLADHLVETGHLNSWQAGQLLEGQTRFTLGPYRIIDSLGRGGMGQVFLATINNAAGNSSQKVAVKVLRRDRATPIAIEAFRREIVAHSELNHPNLVRALDAGFDGNAYYMVSEYVPGKNLRQLIHQHGPLPVAQAAHIIAQAAAGLEHAHQNGWIHRDIKPGNILVTPDGTVKLADLGLAGPLTQNESDQIDPCYNVISGTADYLCPDQVRSPREPTPGWDIYSLGCTLYYAITGKVPFPGGTTEEKAKAHCNQMPIDPRRIVSGISDDFIDVLVSMISKDPQTRLPTARAVITSLEPFARSTPIPQPEQNLETSPLRETNPEPESKTSPIVPLFVLVVLPIVVVMLLAAFHFALT